MPVYQLSDKLIFPPPNLAEPEGILAVGGDLSVPRLLLAYSMGIFPWYSEGDPILWWSPDPRLVLIPEEVKVSKSLARVVKSDKYSVTFDRAFDRVIRNCAEARRPQNEGTWIVPEMIEAYCALHRAGFAHSVEVWKAGELSGGLYGVSIGRAFFGESMFSAGRDASKVALVYLARTLESWDFDFIDCQVTTEHLQRMGAYEIPRSAFLKKLERAMTFDTRRGVWSVSDDF